MSDNYIISVPDAPIDHADEQEHRRLIARRANSIHNEHAKWTPTFTFAVLGDATFAYDNQEGGYWWLGENVYFHCRVRGTPTHTTASGELRITGLPYAQTTDHLSYSSCALGEVRGAGLTWPGGRTQVVGMLVSGTSFIVLRASGSAQTAISINASDHTSGTEIEIDAAGFYPAVQEDN